METINKLLKKQAPKTNARRKDFNPVAGNATPNTESQRPDPLFVRWVNNKTGSRIGIAEEWLDAPAGDVFIANGKPPGGIGSRLVTEVL